MKGRAGLIAFIAIGLLLLTAGTAEATYLTPSNTVKWPGSVPFEDPHGIAVDPSGERVFVADTGRNLIQEFTDGGVPIRRLGGTASGVGRLVHPTGVTVDSHGFVYVADTGNGRIAKFAENGNFIRYISVPFVFKVAASPNGRIYALTNFFGLVAIRSGSGDDLGAWTAGFPGRFWAYQGYDDPTNDVAAIATDHRGRVLVTGTSSQSLSNPPPDCHSVNVTHHWPDPLRSGEVAKYDGAGNALGYGWLNHSPVVCTADPASEGIPRGVASDPNDGSIYVADGHGYIDQLPDLTSANQGVRSNFFQLPIPPYGSADSYSTNPLDAAIDCRSNLYVLTPDRVIKYFSPAGTPSSTCRKPPGAFKQLSFSPFPAFTPHGVALLADCGGASCKGLLSVSARVKKCHEACVVAHVSAPFKFGRGRVHKIKLPSHGRLGQMLKLGVPLKITARAFDRRHHVIGQGSAILREPSSLRISCPSRTTAVDRTASVSGLLRPERTSPRLVISYSTSGAPTVRHLVTPGPHGHWSDSFRPSRSGSWEVGVYWAGDGKYMPAQAGCSLAAARAGSTLGLNCPGGGFVIVPGTSYTFTGKLTPAVNRSKVTLTYTRPDMTTFLHVATTGPDGKYGDKFQPGGNDFGDGWTVGAHFFGDRTRNPSDPPTSCHFDVHYP